MPTYDELIRRLEAAEAVCALYGWSAGSALPDHPRSLATMQAWMEWYELVGTERLDALREVYADERIERMAAVRREIETRTDTWIDALMERPNASA
jgi:hypothetical protein